MIEYAMLVSSPPFLFPSVLFIYVAMPYEEYHTKEAFF